MCLVYNITYSFSSVATDMLYFYLFKDRQVIAGNSVLWCTMVFSCLSTVCAVVTLGVHTYLIVNNLSYLEHSALKKGNPFSHRTPVTSPDLLTRFFIFVRSSLLRKAKNP